MHSLYDIFGKLVVSIVIPDGANYGYIIYKDITYIKEGVGYYERDGYII
jgi:hypothetical protein